MLVIDPIFRYEYLLSGNSLSRLNSFEIMCFIPYKIYEVIIFAYAYVIVVARGVTLWYYADFGVSFNLLRLETLCVSYDGLLCYVLGIWRRAWEL